MNVYVANIPGPPVPLYLGGVRVMEVFPLVPLIGNLTLGIGALSYDRQFNVIVVAARDACSDVRVFVERMGNSLDELTRSEPRTSSGAAAAI
jgi:diacylglycerol O-acyltransferase